MRTSEIILKVIGVTEPVNRTVLQKKIYFLSEILADKELKIELNFRPHLFGPYSEAVTNELNDLTSIGLLTCETIRLGESESGFEVKRFDYRLTPSGRVILASVEADAANYTDMQRIDNVLNRFKELGSEGVKIDYNLISVAAKAHFLLRNDGALGKDSFREKARDLGWTIKSSEIVDQAFSVLVKAGLAEAE